MGVRVRSNRLGAIADALPREIANAVTEAADSLEQALESRVWIDTGVIKSTVNPRPQGPMHAEVIVGNVQGRGFYARFHEFGTVKMGANPVVGPTAHEFEPVYAQIMTQAVRKAVRAG